MLPTCDHEDFQTTVEFNDDDNCADVRVWCDDCGEGFLWLGAPRERLLLGERQKLLLSVDEGH